ncbi:replication restart helicase PriA [Sandaracinomonas limnophila]|uniref:replication restart helicase PriA n=1 Tax=Sandaracinomonas limnophila TaxID=1862386 RepID=UPI001EED2815|nr:primosomal protein N' [Sandaracinomonas limnophila]
MQTFFVDIILPVPIPGYFTYRVPKDWEAYVQKGIRVVVPFGTSKVYTGVIVAVHSNPPTKYQAKYLLEILDEYPLINDKQLDLIEWIAGYYMCTPGDVFQAALPAGLKISSQSKIQLNPTFEEWEQLTEKESVFCNFLKEKESCTFDEAKSFLEVKSPYYLIKSLVGKSAIFVFDELKDRYSPKIIRKIRLTEYYTHKEHLTQLIGVLEAKPKQLAALLLYLQHISVLRDPSLNAKGLDKKIFTQSEISESSIQTLLKNEVFEVFEQVISRFSEGDDELIPTKFELSNAQNRAFQEILKSFETKDICLLKGVTGSGKTEIYIRLIQEALANGDQVLYLLPEIALTTQIVMRLKKIFGEQLGIYHSKFSDNERVEVWKSVAEGKYSFIVGVRSSVFLPFNNLGLVIVDEEHETSFKQTDPAPRYHARDVVTILAKMHQAKVLLGSATPSFETYYQAKNDKFGLVELNERYGETLLPEIHLIDTKYAAKAKQMNGGFSEEILDKLRVNLEAGKQSLLFQNRRGYSPYIQCQLCEWIAQCTQCDVSLTFHARDKELKCHYCGYKETLPTRCGACGGTSLQTMGYGTEKIEEEIQMHIPGARIGRVDLDTTRSKTAFQNLILDVQNGNLDIIVGTQMVAKGLDFDGLSMVGIFDADKIINFPDFRAHERAYQLITQVAGRAGRRGAQGEVYIQTNQPTHALFQAIIDGDYEGLYQEEIVEREGYNYPPYVRLIRLVIKHVEDTKAKKAANDLGNLLKQNFGAGRILGPEKPLIEKIRNLYAQEILIKIENGVSLSKFKINLRENLDLAQSWPSFKGVQLIVDVDCL